jgi:hypothetical protein
VGQMRKYLDAEGVTTALRAAGWTWLALSVVLYILTASLVAVFHRSGPDIALAAAGLMAPGILALLAPSVLRALRIRTKRDEA